MPPRKHGATKNVLHNLAVALKKDARYVAAIEAFEKLEADYGEALDDDIRQGVESHFEELKALVATLQIIVNQPGAQIEINGEARRLSHEGTLQVDP